MLSLIGAAFMLAERLMGLAARALLALAGVFGAGVVAGVLARRRRGAG